MTVFGTGDARNTEGVTVIVAAFMDGIGEALGAR
jgi:hypothetical protein